jgi:NAD(P)-dependent dehydrogenase (short-subunit alcohol dehydrogenase family)
MSQDLEGKVAIVTGAAVAGGIGIETVRVLAAAGAKVVLADLPSMDLDAAAAQVAEAGEIATHPVDISDEASVKALMDFTVERFGRLDVLDNNAARQGLAEDTIVTELTVELWDSVFAVNGRGNMLMCKHAIPRMVASGGGSIVNIASGTTAKGDDAPTAYACSKGAVEVLTRYVATQYAHHGIRCNGIAPGLIRTTKFDEVLPPPVQEIWGKEVLLGHFGAPRDIAETVLFLASDRSAYITGEIITVGGGLFTHMPMLTGTRALVAQMTGA